MKRRRKFSEELLDNKLILKSLNICVGQTTLDAGCGNGYMAKRFSKLVGDTGKVFALDTDKTFIDKLNKETIGKNITAVVDDITALTELKAHSFDLVYLSTVFHIFTASQISGFIEEIERIMKPKGRLAIVNIKKEDTSFGPPIEMRSSPEELREKLPFIPDEVFEVGEYFYMQIFEMLK